MNIFESIDIIVRRPELETEMSWCPTPPIMGYILTEAGEIITTEAGQKIQKEAP